MFTINIICTFITSQPPAPFPLFPWTIRAKRKFD